MCPCDGALQVAARLRLVQPLLLFWNAFRLTIQLASALVVVLHYASLRACPDVTFIDFTTGPRFDFCELGAQ